MENYNFEQLPVIKGVTSVIGAREESFGDVLDLGGRCRWETLFRFPCITEDLKGNSCKVQANPALLIPKAQPLNNVPFLCLVPHEQTYP